MVKDVSGSTVSVSVNILDRFSRLHKLFYHHYKKHTHKLLELSDYNLATISSHVFIQVFFKNFEVSLLKESTLY